MTNKEKYKQAFSVLHTSNSFSVEVEKMDLLKRKQRVRRLVAVAVVLLVVASGSGTAYAANVGGIQRVIQLWIQGDKTDVTVDFTKDGSYNMSYHDKNGKLQQRGGNGVAIENDGSTRALTKDELMEDLNEPEVEYKKDGSVWVYYFNQKIDITDKFKDKMCYVQLKNGDETLYMTIKYNNGWSTSREKYMSPSEFN